MLKLLIVMCGGAFGASLRWGIGLLLSPLFFSLPLGTLAANWLGSFLIGLVLPVGALFFSISDYTKLFFITGFLGSLTTFSTFSGEMTMMLLEGHIGWMTFGIFAHVAGSIIMTVLGTIVIRSIMT